MDYRRLILALFAFIFLNANVYATTDLPLSGKTEDLTEKFQLDGTDEIIINTKRLHNPSLADSELVMNKITDEDDIKTVLDGFSKMDLFSECGSYDKSYGEILFYKNNNKIFQAGITFHYSTPVFFLGETCYINYLDQQFVGAILKYLPSETQKQMQQLNEGILKGNIH